MLTFHEITITVVSDCSRGNGEIHAGVVLTFEQYLGIILFYFVLESSALGIMHRRRVMSGEFE
jgi:hypothetical protein